MKAHRQYKTCHKIILVIIASFLCLNLYACSSTSEDKDYSELNEYLGEDVSKDDDEVKDTETLIEINETAKEVVHYEENYEIAVVFDNSGSMYLGNNSQAWCRAKYAMEIFASMLNYNDRNGVSGDKLSVFPMWDVVTDGSTPENSKGVGSTDPIEITCLEDIDKIHNLYTLRALGTPYSTVENAYNSLKESQAIQKWLIVLTDGEFDNIDSNTLGTNLASLANEDIKVQYLGIGEAANLDEYANEYFYTKKSASSDNLKSDIIEICNRIFQRDQLPSNALDSNKLILDISMSSLIVFVQGENATIKSLKDESGNEIEIISDSGQRKYSELNAGNYQTAPVDNTLSGQVVTFGACKAGTYTVEYKDAESIQFFYTPDIDIMLTFSDANGNVIDISGNSEKLYPGEYTLNYYLIDAITNEDVTNNSLISPVEFDGGYETSDGISTSIENGGHVKLEPDDATFLKVSATYLNDYHITTENRKTDYTIQISYPTIDVKLLTNQKDNWFAISDFENWEPIIAKLTIDGKDLSDSQFEGTELNLTFDKGELPYRIERCEGESLIKIYLGQNDDKSQADIDIGEYIITAQAKYDYGNAEDVTLGKKDSTDINIESYPKWLKYVVIGLGILLLIIAYLIFINRKYFPTKMYLRYKQEGIRQYKFRNSRKKQSIDLFPKYYSKITCDAEKESKYKDRKKSSARVKITNIKVKSPDITEVTIDNNTYIKDGTDYKCNGELLKDLEFRLKNGVEIEFVDMIGTHTGTIECPRK